MSESVRFQHYEVLRRGDGELWELGRGAMGVTYKAYDTNLRCHAALKVINASYLGDETARQRFLREARAAAAIRHPNVAPVYHLGTADDAFFYAMEFIEGETVEEFMKREGVVPTATALDIVQQVARALAAAEKQGLVHRDIKPSNLMLVRADGEELVVKVIDFGLAKGADRGTESDAATITVGGFLGTPHFASPEQLEEGELDIRSDIYSLGVTLYYLLAGRAPFSGSLAQVMSQHLQREPPLEKLGNQPPEIITLLARMLSKDPEGRPASAAILRADVERCQAAVRADGQVGPMEESGADVTVVLPEVGTETRRTDPTASGVAPEPGTVLAGRFELLDEGTVGEWGRTFRTKDLESGEVVAVLILGPGFLPDSQITTRLEADISVLQNARHASIVRIDSLVRAPPTNFLVREWVEGSSLLDALRERGPLPAGEAMTVLTSLAGGLEAVMRAGVPCPKLAADWITLVPGEIAPGQPKFNALNLTDVAPFDAEATIVGPAGDRLRESGAFDENPPAEFSFALAAIAYEIFEGSRPDTASGSFVPVGNLSEDANRVLRQAFDPTKGYRSPVRFIAELSEAVGDPCGVVSAPAPADVEIQHPKSETPRISRGKMDRSPRRKFPLAIVVLATLVVVLLGAIATLVFRDLDDPSAPRPTAAPSPAASPDSAEPIAAIPTIQPPETAVATPSANVIDRARTLVNDGQLGPALQVLTEAAETPEGLEEMERVAARIQAAPPSPERFADLESPLREAAERGSDSARIVLAEHYRETDPEEFYRYASMADEAGSAEGARLVAKAYESGSGVAADRDEAIAAYRRAADRGEARALFAMGLFHHQGRDVPQDTAEAITYLEKSGAAGSLHAQTLLGVIYRNGEGIAPDYAEAFRLLKGAADEGFAPAQVGLGVMYLEGQVVDGEPIAGEPQPAKADREAARALFKKAVDQGNKRAEEFYQRTTDATEE
ncbi:MAG: protein kinase [Chthoniobacterales bacterium]